MFVYGGFELTTPNIPTDAIYKVSLQALFKNNSKLLEKVTGPDLNSSTNSINSTNSNSTSTSNVERGSRSGPSTPTMPTRVSDLNRKKPMEEEEEVAMKPKS